MNLRDLGGYPTPNGSTRRGVAFRSDNLASLTDADVEALTEIGIRSVIDLRRDGEIARDPSRLPPTVEHRLHLPMGGHASHQIDWVQLMLDGEITEFPISEAVNGYREMLTAYAGEFARIVEHIAVADHAPTLFHCTAGKDRTGVTAMLLLGLVGVDRAHIESDYLLTNELRSQHRMAELTSTFEERGVDIENFRAMFTAPPEAIAAALDLVDEIGGYERYLIELGGLDPASMDALRERLVEAG